MNINGSTGITGIFGFPVEHSLSPQMQNAAFAALRLNYVYIPCRVEPRALQPAIDAVRTLGIKGINVTLPHKENVLQFLDRLDPLARRIGSVNTIVNNGGVLTGFNTDASGFLKDIKKKGFSPRRKRALLIGAGGGARAAACALSEAGLKTLYVTSRTSRHAARLAADIPGACTVPLGETEGILGDVDLVVNATPVGLRAGDPAPVSLRHIEKNVFVYDMIYNRPTQLLKDAAKAGARASGGFGMLLNQGTLAFELWTGRKAPVRVMQKALANALKKEHRI